MLTPHCRDSVPVLGRPGLPDPRTPCKGHSPALPAASPPRRDWGQTPPGVWGTCVTSWDEPRGGGGRGGGGSAPCRVNVVHIKRKRRSSLKDHLQNPQNHLSLELEGTTDTTGLGPFIWKRAGAEKGTTIPKSQSGLAHGGDNHVATGL